jgi:metallo-beta-lactamase family protein
VKKIESFSGHGDYKEMISFLNCQDKKALQKVFLVHGEHETQKKYALSLTEDGFRNIGIPAKGEEFEI